MIASLPMYVRPETIGPLTRFWESVRDHLRSEGIEAHEALDNSIIGVDAWKRPDLLLSQTCGAPFRDHLHGSVNLVGTPDARLPTCPPGYYQSVLIARDLLTWGDAITLNWTANEPGSQSGNYAAKVRAPANLKDPEWSGSHLTSIEMVSDGRAEWASVDAVTWEIAIKARATDGLIVWDRTDPTPGLPYITALGNDPEPISQSVRAAISDLDPSDRDWLCIHDLIDIPIDAYLAVPKP